MTFGVRAASGNVFGFTQAPASDSKPSTGLPGHLRNVKSTAKREARATVQREREFAQAQRENKEIGATLAAMKRHGVRPSQFHALMQMGDRNRGDAAPLASIKSDSLWKKLLVFFYAGDLISGNPETVRAGRVARDTETNTPASASAAAVAATAPVHSTLPADRTTGAPTTVASRASSPSSAIAETQAFSSDWIDNIEWIAFDEVAFLAAWGEKISPEARLAGRLRAIHACFSPKTDSDDTVYALIDEDTVDLSPLTEAASRLGSDPANHAPTIEHFLAMAAALRHEESGSSVMSYIHSPDVHTYTRTPTYEDFGAMAGLLGNIMDRSKRQSSCRVRGRRISDRS